jgi:hypothetical protein
MILNHMILCYLYTVHFYILHLSYIQEIVKDFYHAICDISFSYYDGHDDPETEKFPNYFLL